MRIMICSLALMGFTACSGPEAGHRVTSKTSSERFTVSVSGSGLDVLLVPGLASSADVWRETAEHLDDTYTVHVVQVSGFAGAPARANAGDEPILHELAHGLAEYAGSLDTPPAYIGHSMGGLMGLMIAADHPGHIDRLMVVDALPFFSALIDPDLTSETAAPLATGTKAMMIAQTAEIFEMSQRQSITSLVKDDTTQETVLSWSLASDRQVMANLTAEVMSTDMRGSMAGLNVPVTVIYAHDEMMPVDADIVEALYIAGYGVNSAIRLIRVDDSLHFIMYDQPAVFQATVDQFFQQSLNTD